MRDGFHAFYGVCDCVAMITMSRPAILAPGWPKNAIKVHENAYHRLPNGGDGPRCLSHYRPALWSLYRTVYGYDIIAG